MESKVKQSMALLLANFLDRHVASLLAMTAQPAHI
jgi:hypothetical protein